MTDMIQPGERRELRSVVRQQFKVLRTEVKMRETELVAEGEVRIRDRWAEADKAIDDLNWRMRQIGESAQREIHDAIKASGIEGLGGRWRGAPGTLTLTPAARKEEDKAQLHRAFAAGVKQQVQAALLALDRQEADLLRELAMEALETEQARGFLGRIPTVGELVPSARLAEIESAFDGGAR